MLHQLSSLERSASHLGTSALCACEFNNVPQCKTTVDMSCYRNVLYVYLLPFSPTGVQKVVPLAVDWSQNAAFIRLKMISRLFSLEEKLVPSAKTDYISVFWVHIGLICPVRRVREG